MKINWLKVMSIGGTVLGLIGTLLTSIADEKQNKMLIEELVLEHLGKANSDE